MADSIENMQQLLDLARIHGSADLTAWFDQAVSLIMAGEGAEVALGLNANPCERKPITNHQYALRDQHLVKAWHYVSREPIGSSTRANKLSDSIKEFLTDQWQEWCHLDQPPETATKVQRALFYAAMTEIELPTSTKQLRRIYMAYRKERDMSSTMLCPEYGFRHDASHRKLK